MDKVEKAVIDLKGEWPSKDLAGHNCVLNDYMGTSSWTVSRGFDSDYICTYPEFMEARKRLENKPEEWPEGAQILIFSPQTGQWLFGSYESANPAQTCWIGQGPGFWYQHTRQTGMCFGDWRESLERRQESKPSEPKFSGLDPAGGKDETVIYELRRVYPRPQPDNKEGEGVKWKPGVDLPPKGAKCMALVDADGIASDGEKAGRFKKGTYEGFCILPNSGWAYLFKGECGHTFVIGQKELFDHYKSHRDKCIEAARKVAATESGLHHVTELDLKLIRALYDKGCLRLPNDKEGSDE